ncbi:MAG: PD-(D/E)XK nuclease domain-containing protein [Crocinitomicaceae bacterium]
MLTTIFYLILKMIDAHIILEQQTNIGRIDAVVQTKNYCFIIEFKINKPVLKAMEQIEEKHIINNINLVVKK